MHFLLRLQPSEECLTLAAANPQPSLPPAYDAYRVKVPDIIPAHGGRILVRGGDPQPLDGAARSC